MMQFYLLINYLFSQKENSEASTEEDFDWPDVTIQLPVYNEPNVIGRLLETIIKLDYPRSKLFIQILDDSTDLTSDIIHQKTKQYKAQGFQINHIRRLERTGFKAGALQYGMQIIDTPLVAIFDADFVPKPDFLKVSVPYFKDLQTGVVQGRWTHLNQSYSLLTQMQAFQLDTHFTIEQAGRFRGGSCLQFNGTAGIWRKTAIESSGGWSSETLTEDLELSYRAQLNGWKIVFLEDLEVPAELPASIRGLRSQQFRWMKGGAETAKKMIPVIWRSQMSFWQKCQASAHLCSSSVFIAILLMGICSIILPFSEPKIMYTEGVWPYFPVSTFILLLVYMVSYVRVRTGKRFIFSDILFFMVLFPVFLATSMAMSLHNSKASLEGWIGLRSPFIRTPKTGFVKKNKNNGLSMFQKPDYQTIVEFFFFIIFILVALYSYRVGETYLITIHMLFAVGFVTLVYFGIRNENVESHQ